MSDRAVLVILLVLVVACVIAGVAGLFWPKLPADKFMSTAGNLAALASLAQLRVSGWFTSVLSYYGDETKFPFGPPSPITRQIIDNPDHPVQSWIRNTLFFEPRTGAYLAVASLLLAIVGTWAK